MMISSRGRYSLRVMVDLAEHKNDCYIPMKDVAQRQDISLKYISKIMPVLTKAKLVDGVHGKGGGYKLNRAPEEYKVGEILRLFEEDLSPCACLEDNAKPCELACECRTFPMWSKFFHIVNDYFDSITIADLMKQSKTTKFKI